MDFKTGDRVVCQLNGLEGEILGPGMRRESQLVHFKEQHDCAVIGERFLRLATGA